MLGKYTDEIALNRDNMQDVMTMVKILMDNDYVVMLSYEEDLVIVNYVYSEYCNRNDVAFMGIEELYDRFYEKEMESDDYE